ncbi:pyrrolysine--tRNA(Pyl) ligase large subunit [Desulforhopalus singaporensis]|uniref:Phenylalanyl-tRNA synthetase alpha chain n=1 Tax=Desulforhopalus singaporensis TaxID=91360 RepID=A0A1H0KII4_9BACT|nr:pyrrolysine--tRNA(Pyl) ligase large subunit [Desulforhopalus singaporensis]SDO55532.1 phenylalanyl-tRNA synthetase alpha chain [Desulforhopalus singaporensis]
MKEEGWTITQERRLRELGVGQSELVRTFDDAAERNRAFQQLEQQRIQQEKKRLQNFLQQGGRVALEELTEKLTSALCNIGFTRVTTPVIISKSALAKMTVDDDHPLSQQVYWINSNQCLRPMLAPNLYSLMVDFARCGQREIRFFEIGPCFRKESDGARHNSEFTMLNLVEMGTPEEKRLERLQEFAEIVAQTAGLEDYRFESEESKVYGTTVDLVVGAEDIEVASGAVGPHPLDIAWGVQGTWVGIGFGLERLLMAGAKETSISRWGKNLSYLNGINLKL